MDFKVYQQFPQDLKQQWNELLTRSISHVPFLRFEYLQNWWLTRGGGEWPQDSRLVLIAAWQGNDLVGIAPLFHSTHQDRSSLLFLGSIEISDYLSLLVTPENLQSFTSALLDFLMDSQEVPDWQVLDFYNLVASSPLIPVLQKEAESRGWQTAIVDTDHAPAITLPGDWEAYLSDLSKKQRHEIRRKIRRLEEVDGTSRWYIVEDQATLDDEINAFLKLMAEDPVKDTFLSSEMSVTMAATMKNAFQEGYLQLAFLEINGQKAAGYLNFDYLNRIWVYNSGISSDFMNFSAGWVLLGYLLQWANQHKREAFDFLRGNEDYKYRFGAVDQMIKRVSITRS
jgi:CelD/BcsL family acetyltransferase involved in cellulose biosynthesis